MASCARQHLVLSGFYILAILLDVYLGLFFLLHFSLGDGGGVGW